jgi:hypothetical protein
MGNETRSSKYEEMSGHSSSRSLLCFLRVPLARAALLFLFGKKDRIVYLAGRFGRGVFLAGGHHPGARGDRKVSTFQLARPDFRMAEKALKESKILESL